MATTWQDHLKGPSFNGNIQAYADAIKTKEAAGQTLSDPAAAAAFKSANQSYFNSTPAASPSSTSPSTNNNYLSNPSWVGNMFPGATFDPTSRSIAAPGGVTLGENTDFTIGADDRAYIKPSTNVVTQALMALTNQQQQKTPPPMPNVNLQYPQVNSMSYDDAYSQAGKKFDPLTQLSQMQRNRMAQEQRERLPYLLNAKGQLYGGLRRGGEVQIDQDTARALDEMRLLAESQKAEAAQGIYSGDQARADRAAQSMYQQQSDQANIDMRQWEQQIANDRSSDQDKINSLIALSKLAAQNEEAKRASSQDALQASQWNMSKEAQPWYLDMAKKSMEADVNATNRSNIPRASGGGSSGGSGGGSGGGSKGGLTALQQHNIGKAEKEELNADKSALMEGLESNKISREEAISKVQNRHKAGVISYDYANELLRTIDVVAPGAIYSAPTQQASGNDFNPFNIGLSETGL